MHDPGVSTTEALLRIAREGLYLAVLVSAPAVLASMLVGLFVSLFQATTQLQDQTLSFAPKVVAVLVSLAVFGPWIGAQLVRFTNVILDVVPRIA